MVRDTGIIIRDTGIIIRDTGIIIRDTVIIIRDTGMMNNITTSTYSVLGTFIGGGFTGIVCCEAAHLDIPNTFLYFLWFELYWVIKFKMFYDFLSKTRHRNTCYV